MHGRMCGLHVNLTPSYIRDSDTCRFLCLRWVLEPIPPETLRDSCTGSNRIPRFKSFCYINMYKKLPRRGYCVKSLLDVFDPVEFFFFFKEYETKDTSVG